MFNKQCARIYGREYQRMVRLGRSRGSASAAARALVKKTTGYSISARGERALRQESAPRYSDAGLPKMQTIKVPPAVMADAERIRNLDHPTLVGQLMGDPLPGRSALDRRT